MRRQPWRAVWASVFAVLVVGACADAPPDRATSDTAPSSRILFDAVGEEVGEKLYYAIFAINEDGTGLSRLSPSGVSASEPDWSPDHSRIAFQSDFAEPGNTDIYVMAAAGTAMTRLTTNPAIDSAPTWAPDGRTIAFQRGDEKGNMDLVLIEVESRVETRLTDANAVTIQPSWSPNGGLIAFARNARTDRHIYTVDVESRVETQLTFGEVVDGQPAWSPDGSMIAFNRQSEGDRYSDIWVMAGDGSGPQPLRATPANEYAPDWSPDGQKLVFVTYDAFNPDDPVQEFRPAAVVVPADSGDSTPERTLGVEPLFSVSWW